MKSLEGHLLISAPQLADPNFRQAVVLLVHHNEQGALGLTLNRPLSVTVDAIWKQVSDEPCHVTDPVYLGGPCEGPLMALHQHTLLADSEVLHGVSFTTDADKIRQLVNTHTGRARYFVGYSGWGAGQLEHELREESWITPRASVDHVFDSPEELWQRITKELADSVLFSAGKPKHMPTDPSMN